ncbi:mannitol dehydrogenase family protein [Paralcaligenes sp. KSB-10]|uniref:mannitol dehydrogenase family protein n=1 Tax=Paralcaligenes sp. KSB-10 TaxID=2901142 RepID=UPI001E64C719|nr:mannitol dehydrogenase family protein [Paralcaligenes sp. KSB-10]UHL63225.1 mannitol dehydrogenase family protein [Paralcaligenes sp. KSB-10]
MNRLSQSTLGGVKPGVTVPSYDRARVESRIVHLGAGAFHRSHQAVYTDDVMAGGDTRWGIVTASLHSPAISQALTPQDGLYTLLVDDNGTTRARVIGSLKEVLCLGESRRRLQEQLCSPLTEIVSLTITEKGYCYEPSSATLDESHADIRADLTAPWNPNTAIGLLVAAIYERKKNGVKPFTILSCDNLPSNGLTLRRVLERYAELAQPMFSDAQLKRHLLDHYACPCTMVDRITPAVVPADLARAEQLVGAHDASPVVAEPFSQWVIEDAFSSNRPAWESVGATFTDDVGAFEEMKLRLLNGSHSALAYLGGLAGCKTVAAAMQDPGLARFVRALMGDAADTLAMPAGVGLDDYMRSLLRRFGNVSLNHLTAQIAMDGSQKLPQRILEPIRLRLARGLPIDHHALVVAAWIRYLMGRDEQHGVLAINDPMADVLAQALARASTQADDLVAAVLGFAQVFGRDLPGNPVFVRSVVHALQNLLSQGVRATLSALASARVQ